MKKLIFVTMLLHFVTFLQAQNHYDSYPDADVCEIGNYKVEFHAAGKLDNYGSIFRTEQIRNLFEGSDFVDFKVFYRVSEKQIKLVSHGKVRTHFRFSTPLHEAGIYYAVFTPKSGAKKMLYIDAKRLEPIVLFLATEKL